MKKAILLLLLVLFTTHYSFSQNRQLTFEDVMKFEDISDADISANGQWIVYGVWPDRGDGEVRVRSTSSSTFYTIERGDDPEISGNGAWVASFLKPPLKEQLKAEKDKPKQGMGLLSTSDGSMTRVDSVQWFTFSNDSRWIAYRHHQLKEVEDKKSKNDKLGTVMTLRNLQKGTERNVPFVTEAVFDSTSSYLAYSVVDTSGSDNGLYMLNLSSDSPAPQAVEKMKDGYITNLSWDHGRKRIAYTASKLDDKFEPGDASLHLWDAGNGTVQTLLDSGDAPDGWRLRSNNDLGWTYDGNRLFFGLMDEEMVLADIKEEEDTTKEIDIYDREEILKERGVDVWHWDDPRIKTHEKETWKSRKDHLFRAVYHLDKNRWVQLADSSMPELRFTHNARYALGSSALPYLKLMTWEWFFDDYYVVDLANGNRKRVAQKLWFGAQISPDGRFVIYYEDRDWHLYNIEKDIYRNLTEELETPFYNEDHDYPFPPPGYGVGGWVEGSRAVLIYDKYDIWQFPTDVGRPTRITDGLGRDQQIVFRIENLDPERQWFKNREEVLLEAYFDKKKNFGFYTARIGRSGVQERLVAQKKFNVIRKAQEADRILYTRESYSEFPNLWVADNHRFRNRKQVSMLHTDLTEKYAWGSAELVEWTSLDGTPHQGVLIKPGNYEEGKKYPLLVYFYRFFSDRLYDFNEPRNNHRPVFAQYASDGYAVFLPDIRFKVGTPGFEATKSLVPGVQHLVDEGIVDTDKLGLHGHSWSGYQTAFIITQTDIFDAAVAGAPVSNMTSAYSGIRWGSGLARQFQYEMTQSRIGGSLWEYPELYIENSPVFYANRINTPLLIQFGDEDGAVPWYQGIELYLAMRRLGKDAIFLQYHGEPHHLQEYSNKLDYAIKMKEYFDHYLKGMPAPKWIEEGVPYRGDN